MQEITILELNEELRKGARCMLEVRHAERPKMDPDDVTFGDALPLTTEGSRTAKELGKMLAEWRGQATFWASPLKRTRMTAALIAEGMGEGEIDIPTDDRLGNASFYYDDPLVVLEVFKTEEFFHACFDYYATGEHRGFKNLHQAADINEHWLEEHLERKLLIVTTHDCYIAALLAARGVCPEGFSRDNWTRFLDGGAILVYPDGTRRYALVRTGLSTGICGVKL